MLQWLAMGFSRLVEDLPLRFVMGQWSGYLVLKASNSGTVVSSNEYN